LRSFRITTQSREEALVGRARNSAQHTSDGCLDF
jgi:hypothetical protein